jgi:putative ABC transport system substrate-binding protein
LPSFSWPRRAARRPSGRATTGKTARIGFLGDVPSFLDEAFRQGLRELGYVEGRNIAIEYRASE